jgi:hypothetical protein
MGPAPKLRWSAATSDQTGRPRLRLAWPAEQQRFGLDSCISCNSRDFVDHLVIGPSGVFVIDSKQWTGHVHQGADGLAWHNHYPLDRTLATVRWEAEAISRVLGTRAAALLCVHGAHVDRGGLNSHGVAIVPAGGLRDALGRNRVLPDGDVELLAATARMRLRPAT